MTKLFRLPLALALDTNVAKIANAEANFFIAGTTTRKDTFSDSALITENTNPVIADANGQFGTIFLAAGPYKVDITAASGGASLAGYPVDDIQGSTSEVTTVSVAEFTAGGGVDDDGANLRAAVAEGKASKRPVTVPYGGTYLIDSTEGGIGLDLYQVDFIGEGVNPEDGQFNEGELPTIIQGSNVQDLILVGQATDAAGGVSGARFQNILIDGSNAPKIALPTQGARGVFCRFGLINADISNVRVRANRSEWAAPNRPTAAEAATANWSAVKLQLATTTNSGIYYNKFDITAINAYRGFYTDGDAGDGMRACRGFIRAANCAQAVTLAAAEVNKFMVAITQFPTDYDPDGHFPGNGSVPGSINLPASDEMDIWGMLLDRPQNKLRPIFIEGDPGKPVIFTPSGNELMTRNGAISPHFVQTIFNGAKVGGSGRGGIPGFYTPGSEHVSAGAYGGVQGSRNLLPSGDFAIWDGDASSVSDGDPVAGAIKALVGGTGRVDITENEGSDTPAQLQTAGRSAKIQIRGDLSAVETDKVYGLKAAMSAHYRSSASDVLDLKYVHRITTPFVLVRVPQAKTEVFLKATDGTHNVTEQRFIDDRGIDAPAGNDESVIQTQSGEFKVVMLHFDYGGTGDIDLEFGVIPTATNENTSFFVDYFGVAPGRMDEYALRAYVEASAILKPYGVESASSTGTPDSQIPFVDVVTGNTVWVTGSTTKHPA